MTTKVILYISIVIMSISLYFNATLETEYINTKDTLRISNTIFKTDTITKTITNQTTKHDTLEIYYNDTIQMYDTVYVVEFEQNDSNIFISGKTSYRLHSQNTFDLIYKIKPIKLRLNTYWNNGKIKNDLYRNNIKIKVDTKINYDEYNKYVESLKPKFYERPYFVSGVTAIVVGGLFFLIK